jgi:hypothetical protein
MGLWIGAAIDDSPHCAMLFDWTVWSKEGLFNLARQPWLYVDLDGERFMNEDLPWGYECAQILQQPGGVAWSVWDAKYDEEWPRMQSQCCKNMGLPPYLWNQKQLSEALEEGNVLSGQTIEGLAQKMEVPVENFRPTIARYNELARNGMDLDFGKHPDRLTTIFYACKMESRLMVILSGLKVNTRLQVLDIERNVIPGLYAAGNVSGSFFGVGSEEAPFRAGLRPPLKPGVRFSRTGLSQGLPFPGQCKRRYQRNKVNKPHLSVQTLVRESFPSRIAPALALVRPYPAQNPCIETVEEPADVGLAIIVPPPAYDGIDLFNQLLRLHRSLPPCTLAYLLLEVLNRLLARIGIQAARHHAAPDFFRGELQRRRLPPFDLEAEEFKPLPDVHDARLLSMERDP